MAFGSEQNTNYKFIKFPTTELKEQYVTAEFTNSACQDAYRAHQSAWGKAERERTRDVLAEVRAAFYRKWAAKHVQTNKVEPLTEEDFPA